MDIQVSGNNLHTQHALAMEIARKIRTLAGVSDVLVPQDVDYPALRIEVDRRRASELGLSQKEVMQNIITALNSNHMIAPTFWTDPKTGNDYFLTVQYPENHVASLEDIFAIPLRAPGHSKPVRLDALCHVRHVNSPTEVDHYQLRRVVDVYVAPAQEAIDRVYAAVNQIVAETRLPDNVRIIVRGSVHGMESSFRSFGFGLILSIVLVYLILVAQFKSFLDPILILLAVPVGLTGVLVMLALTDTTLNIMSLMGIVMMVGIVVSNSILIVDLTHRLRADGLPVQQAVSTACRVRLRPILMTSLATLLGLLPMALKLGTGTEAYAPLARAIIAGLAVSVVLTMFIVPAACLLAYRKHDDDTAPEARSASVPGVHPA